MPRASPPNEQYPDTNLPAPSLMAPQMIAVPYGNLSLPGPTLFAIYNRLSPRGRECFPAVILAFRAPTASANAAQVIEQAQCPLLG